MKFSFEYMELIRGDVRIEWEWIGEGVDGDYQEDDPYDEPLLRFSVSKRIEKNYLGQEWEQCDDASYCTLLSIHTDRDTLSQALTYLMNEFYEPVTEGHSIKKLGERMSWIDLKWILPDKKKTELS